MLKPFGFKEFVNFESIHCMDSFSFAATHNDGWKVTYSGDSRPSADLVKHGMNSTLLIHESNFTNVV